LDKSLVTRTASLEIPTRLEHAPMWTMSHEHDVITAHAAYPGAQLATVHRPSQGRNAGGQF
jgi:hypothetical protein